MTQGARQRYEAVIKDREMWEVYWHYISVYKTRSPPLRLEHKEMFKKADKMMINDLFISNK